MSDQSRPLETMSCEELLWELARLTSERDHVHAEVATPSQTPPEREPQVVDMLNQSTKIDGSVPS